MKPGTLLVRLLHANSHQTFKNQFIVKKNKKESNKTNNKSHGQNNIARMIKPKRICMFMHFIFVQIIVFK